MNNSINSKENVVHKKISFYDTKCDIKDVCICPAHWHNSLEILVMREGSVKFIVKEEEIVLSAGDFVIVPPLTLHAIINSNSSLFYVMVINLDDFINPITAYEINRFKTMDLNSSLVDDEVAHIVKARIIELISVFTEGKKISNIQLSSLVYSLFTSFYDCKVYNEEYLDKGNEDIVKMAVQYIENNYEKRITVEELSKYVNISKYHFIRLFKKCTNHTPNKYINIIRINEACEFLNAGMSVKETAVKCGFESANYFTECFKQIRKVTPTEYLSNQ